jgi:hypothetical protein
MSHYSQHIWLLVAGSILPDDVVLRGVNRSCSLQPKAPLEYYGYLRNANNHQHIYRELV